MMNLTINRDDYINDESFMIHLKRALRYKGTLLAKQAVNSLDTSNMYKTVFPDYLYYRLFEEIGEPLVSPVSTYIINVEQIGGEGGYFIKYGKYRKNTNVVEFKIYPPVGLYIAGVTYNQSRLVGDSNNIFSFTMPEEDVLIQITYSMTQPVTQLVYFGYNIENVEDIYTGSTIIIDPVLPFTVPFYNVGVPGRIWFATKRDVTKQTQNIGEQFDLSDTFESLGTFGEYTIYRHLWITEIDTITFE